MSNTYRHKLNTKYRLGLIDDVPILNPSKTGRGLKYRRIQFKHKERGYLLHRVVYGSFYQLIDGLEINHIDGNPSNNRLDNLEQITASQNVKHAYDFLNRKSPRTGKFGSETKCNIHISQFDKDMNLIKEFDCITTAMKETNTTHISDCAKGHRKTAGGFIWRYKNNLKL